MYRHPADYKKEPRPPVSLKGFPESAVTKCREAGVVLWEEAAPRVKTFSQALSRSFSYCRAAMRIALARVKKSSRPQWLRAQRTAAKLRLIG